MHAIPERLRGVLTTRRYTNTRLPLPLPLPLEASEAGYFYRLDTVPKAKQTVLKHWSKKNAYRVNYKFKYVNPYANEWNNITAINTTWT